VDAPLVFATVGTEHYPFDRLVNWVDGWAADRARAARVVIQYGASSPPSYAEGISLLPYEEFEKYLNEASIVVSHGGVSVMQARQYGAMPVVVPREHALGENVDDHQVAWAEWMHARGELVLVRTGRDLRRVLDGAMDGRMNLRIDPPTSVALATSERFGELVAGLFRVGRR